MKFYIDFDYTMFDAMEFHKARYEEMKCYNISMEELKALEKEIPEKEGRLINLDDVYSKISEKYKLPKEEVLGKIHTIMDNCHKYLYEDTIEFLKYLKSRGHELYILTWGDKELQYQKIQKSGIEQYFEQIILTEEMKFNIDIDYKNGIFLDDNPRDLEGLYKNNPIEVIRIKRNGAKYSDKPINIKIKEFATLKELQKNMQEQEI